MTPFIWEEWKWSNYRSTDGYEKSHLCLRREWILGQFAERKNTAEGKYIEFVEAGIGKDTITLHFLK